MGNSSSSQRPDFSQRDHRHFRPLPSNRIDSSSSLPNDGSRPQHPSETERPSLIRPRRQSRTDFNIYGTFRRQISSQSVRVQRDTGETIGTDAVVYEQEERPLVNMEDLRMRDAPITHVAAAPLARRPSTMSRLGSRMLPTSVARSLINSGEETDAEGRAHRMGISGNQWNEEEFLRLADSGRPRPRRSIYSLFRSSRTPNLSATRRTLRTSLSPQYAGSQPLSDESDEANNVNLSASVTDTSRPSASLGRRARLSRVRNSLSLPLQSLFNPLPDSPNHPNAPEATQRRPSRAPFAEDSHHLLPPLSTMDHRLDLEDVPHELDAVEPEARNLLSAARLSQSGMRRLPHALRSRSTRLIRRGEHPPLSQVLQLAAASIAAQLSGNPSPLASGVRSLGNEALDGPIQSFVRTLQEAADAQAGETSEGNGDVETTLPPVNFLRVFQFPNADGPSQTPSLGGNMATAGRQAADPLEDTPNARPDSSVTLVLVGVRSMPSSGDGTGEEGTLGTSLDALLSMPFLPTTNTLRNSGSGALLRRSDARSRLSSRRNSMTSFSSFPAQYDSQRHHRTRNTPIASAELPLTTPHPNSLPSMLSESPPGPVPPPSTPADPRSGAGTPNRRPSSASAIHSPILPHLDEHPSLNEDGADENIFNPARHRRRSDSEFARRPELSSGATRRNGVVEPDNASSTGGRSWLIYVVGTNVSPDHPAFTMPTLFTDNPTYEDMQLLSTLLGPVKPPVASQDDVTSAGGLFRLAQGPLTLVGQPAANNINPSIAILAGDRCLICLSDYTENEVVRQLNKCEHVFHRECIDEVSNSLHVKFSTD